MLRRHLILGALILLAVLISASDALYALATRLVVAAEGIIAVYPTLGMVLFVVLTALSAMLMFFSSALLVPVGVYAWGKLGCFLLLWLGWLFGGIASYQIGRYLGQPVVKRFVPEEKLAHYEARIATQAPFYVILLFQLALPSEIPGYVLGTLRYRFTWYLAVLALAELPYALGTVFLGAGFLQRRYLLMIGLGTAGVILAAWSFRRLQQQLSEKV